MTHSRGMRLVSACCVAGAVLIGAGVSVAGPNLMAIGNYGDVPYKRAVGRDSFSGKEVVYSFDDPEFHFGRIVVRAGQPNSVVRRDLFVGFNGEALIVDTRGPGGSGSAVKVDELEVWLRIQGRIRQGASYEWEIEAAADQDILESGFPAVIPALWADGEPIGAEVTVRTPEPADNDRIQRMLLPHGVVSIKPFERRTGGAWVVLKLARFGSFFAVRRFSFREVDTGEALAARTDMPIPVRYIPIRDVLEDSVAEALERGAESLRKAQNPEHYWPGSDLEESVRITSLAASALAELDPETEALMPSMKWLARQEPVENEPWNTTTVAERLFCLARHGGRDAFRRVISADIQFLTVAQSEDGGWSGGEVDDKSRKRTVVRSDNVTSAVVLRALREARFAGAEIDNRIWRRVMQYWTAAQAYDGGFRRGLERYGGVGEATSSAYTSLGGAALISALDMAAGFGGRRCTRYLSSRKQLRAIGDALKWLNSNYGETFNTFASKGSRADPYDEPFALQWLGEVSGLSSFNGKDHFGESAHELLKHYDRQTRMFGARGEGEDGAWAESPSVMRTARALSILGAGAAPTICQRIILGEDEKGWAQYNGDAAHLVRYLSARRGRPFNWRRASIEDDLRELARVPILLLTVVGPFDWPEERWSKIRGYCFAGGSVVIDVADNLDAERGAVVSALKSAFPEYELVDLPPNAPVFTSETKLSSPPAVKALGNGFRYFLFLPGASWSCRWHLYKLDDHEESFAFMDNLLTYVTDGTPPRSSFTLSTYAVGSVPAHSMKGAHLEVGGKVPAYPGLIDTMNRLMEANFRLGVSAASDPNEADVVWVSVTGDAAPSEEAKRRILDATRSGRYLFVDVVSGRGDWDEGFRAVLQRIEGITLRPLRRTDPIYTGEIPGTQGFDVVEVELRKALHTRFATRGRCDLYSIRYNGEPAGVYSAYDISSGIGYHYFPGCRGVMPEHAREIAMNVFLTAYEWKVHPRSSD